jgi:hypothetical protein
MSLKDAVSQTKDLFTLAKDLFVGVLVGALLLWPAGLNDRLQKAGFSKGDFGPLTWQAAATAQSVSQAKQDVQDGTGALENIAADPKYAKDERLKQVLEKLKSSETSITTADSTLKTTVAQQQSAVQQETSKPTPSTGWLMLGRIDENRQHWVTANIKALPGSSFSVGPGQEVQLSETVYLRAENTPGQRAAGTILNVLQPGTKLKVLQVDTQSSHALAGGYFVWAQVEVEQSS